MKNYLKFTFFLSLIIVLLSTPSFIPKATAANYAVGESIYVELGQPWCNDRYLSDEKKLYVSNSGYFNLLSYDKDIMDITYDSSRSTQYTSVYEITLKKPSNNVSQTVYFSWRARRFWYYSSIYGAIATREEDYTGTETCILGVIEDPNPPEEFYMYQKITAYMNDSEYIGYATMPSDADTYITWTSDNTKVAVIDKKGKITCKTPGTATITAITHNGLSAQCLLTVLPTPITFLSASPPDGEFNVKKDKQIEISFSQNVAEGEKFSEIMLYDNTSKTYIDYQTEINANKLTIIPGGLTEGHTYIATVPAGSINSTFGAALEEDCGTTFTVVPVVVKGIYVDKINYYVVDVMTDITVECEGKILKGSAWEDISITKASDGTNVEFDAYISGNELIISPKKQLDYCETYSVNVPKGALACDTGLESTEDIATSFTTKSGELKVVNTTPANNTNNISRNPEIILDFNYLPYVGDAFSDIKLINAVSGEEISGKVTLDNKRLTFEFEETLDYLGKYTFVIPQGALENDAFEAIQDYKFSFYTLSPETETVNAPKINVLNDTVTITAEEGATVYYTIDGTNPEESGLVYTEPFKVLERNAKIKAVAHKNGVASVENSYDFESKTSIGYRGCITDEDYDATRIDTKDGGYITYRNAKISKYYATGELQWENTYSQITRINDLVESDDGYAAVGYITKTNYYGSYNNGAYLKIDLQGNVICNKTNSEYAAFSYVIDTHDGYIISGKYSSSYRYSAVYYRSGHDYIIKISTDGSTEWSKSFNSYSYSSSGIELAPYYGDVSVSVDENAYIITGYFDTPNSDSSYIKKYDLDGTLIWEKIWKGTYGLLADIVVTEDGYVCTGAYPDNLSDSEWSGAVHHGGEDASIIKFDKDGNVLWANMIGGVGDDVFYALTEDKDGFAVVGQIEADSFNTGDFEGISGNGEDDIFIVKFDKNGNAIKKGIAGEHGNINIETITSFNGEYEAYGKGTILKFRDKDFVVCDAYADYSLGKAGVSGKDKWHAEDEIVASVYFTPNEDTSFVSFDLSYSPEMTYIGEMFPMAGVTVKDNGDNTISVECDFDSANNLILRDENCIAVRLKFKMNENCNAGNYAISVENASYVTYTSGEEKSFDETENYDFRIENITVKELFIVGKKDINSAEAYKAVFFPENTYDKNVEWSVSDETIATVDSNGVVKPISSGEFTLYAKSGGVTTSFDVAISTVTAEKPNEKQLDVTITDVETSDGKLSVSANIINEFDLPNVTIIKSAYSKEGALIKTEVQKDLALQPGENNVNIGFDRSDITEEFVMKIMFWDTIHNMIPVANVYEFSQPALPSVKISNFNYGNSYVTAEIENMSDKKLYCDIYTAIYDTDGRLVNVFEKEQTFETDEKNIFMQTANISSQEKIKMFVWEKGTMIPLAFSAD